MPPHFFTASLDPTLLPGLPRVDNQYNEDYVDDVDHFHARNHGDFYVAFPHEEWACRTYGTSRYWFYRAWFHYRTIKWDNDTMTWPSSNPPMASSWTGTPPPPGKTVTIVSGALAAGNLS